MSDENDCQNCQFLNVEHDNDPCHECMNTTFKNWTSKEPEPIQLITLTMFKELTARVKAMECFCKPKDLNNCTTCIYNMKTGLKGHLMCPECEYNDGWVENEVKECDNCFYGWDSDLHCPEGECLNDNGEQSLWKPIEYPEDNLI